MTTTALAATTDLVAGATRWRRALDAALSALCGRSVEALDAPLRQVLRVALYELASACGRRRDRRRRRENPASAAAGIVAAAVDLARRTGHAGSAKLANAVLRKAARAILEEEEEEEQQQQEEEEEEEEGGDKDDETTTTSTSTPTPLLPRSLLPPAPPPSAPERARLRHLAVAWSHPDWLARRWVERFGVEGAERLMSANNRGRPRHALRAVVVAGGGGGGDEGEGASSSSAREPAALLGEALDSLVGGGDGSSSAAEKETKKEKEKEKKKLVAWSRSRVLPREFVVVEKGMGAALSGVVRVRGGGRGRSKNEKGSLSNSSSEKEEEKEQQQQEEEKTLPAKNAVVVVSAAVQDEAAGAVVAFADPRPGERVLDVCAAPGGKALFAAARMGRKGLLVARDSSGARLAPLRRAAEAQGVSFPFLVVEEADGTANEDGRSSSSSSSTSSSSSLFDLVLVDAPCSGTGVLGKRADARWRKKASDLEQLARLQDKLLREASRSVSDGGRLVYSTCSLEPEENAERVRAFLSSEEGAEFELERVDAASVGLPVEFVNGEGFFEALPHVHGTDGAFAARMRRRK